MSNDKQVFMHGNPLNLLGETVSVGQDAPDVELLNNDLAPVKISDYKGKVVILSVVPSLDTPTCDLQTRRFNSEAAGLGDDVAILTISMDLPFAQKRWCGAAGADAVITLSDHREAAFGMAYGLLIKELRLLARTVLVLDREGKITYIQRVKELSEEPEYDEVLEAVKKVV
ncbi:MAG: thiol peroxidase [Deltaproteobacteria bacterium]|nr:thiol peroxidase [Deltaproteobacteria bacterium]